MWGKPKGIKRILEEKELWQERLNLDCQTYKNKKLTEDSLWVNYCLKRIMTSQPDFIAQKSAIVELIEMLVICIFFI